MKTNVVFISSILLAAVNSVPFESVVDVTEDTLGNYKFGFDSGDYSKHEERAEDGSTKGKFSFVDSDGVKRSVEYHGAAEQGFIAKGDHIPVDVVDTSENIESRQQHLSVFKSIESDPRFVETSEDANVDPISPEKYLFALKEQLNPSVPLQFLEDTPEIAAAKVELAAAHTAAVGH